MAQKIYIGLWRISCWERHKQKPLWIVDHFNITVQNTILYGWASTGSKSQHSTTLWAVVSDAEADGVETAFHAYCKEQYTGTVASEESSESTTTVKSKFCVDCNIEIR